MDLMQHVINLAAPRGMSHAEGLKRLPIGTTVTRVMWDGCMATIRKVEGVGKIIRHEKLEGRYEGVVVLYPFGERWEPLDYIKFVGNDGAVEAWH